MVAMVAVATDNRWKMCYCYQSSQWSDEDIRVTCVISSPDWLRWWSLALARKLHLKIDSIMTTLVQDHRLVAEHS